MDQTITGLNEIACFRFGRSNCNHQFSAFQMTCDKIGGTQNRSCIVVTHFIKCPAASAFNHHIALWSKSYKRRKEGTIASSCKAVNYLLNPYAPNGFITKKYVHVLGFTLLSIKCLRNMANVSGTGSFYET